MRFFWWLLLGALAFFVCLLVDYGRPQLSVSGAPHSLTILMYHKVNPDPRSGGLGLRVPPERFEEQMRYLRDHGYSVVSMDDVAAFLKAERNLPPKPVVITFDDGYRDNYLYAFPILKKYGYTATIYLVAHAVGRYNFFDADRGVQPRNEMLTWAEIKVMHAQGITFGAHTLDHPSLAHVSLREARRQIFGSKKLLEKKLGWRIDHFSYPYGHFNPQVAALVAAAGFRTAVTALPGVNYPGDNPFVLRRIRITGKYNLERFARALNRYTKVPGGDGGRSIRLMAISRSNFYRVSR